MGCGSRSLSQAGRSPSDFSVETRQELSVLVERTSSDSGTEFPLNQIRTGRKERLCE